MNENPVSESGVPEEKYHTLGKKTFCLFLLQRIHPSTILLLAVIGLFVLRKESFFAKTPIGDVRSYVNLAAWGVLAIFLVVLGITILITWLIYYHYKFCLSEYALKIKRGILNKEETAIPYRQIQNVGIDRDLSFQVLGLSRLAILTAGNDDEKSGEDESEGILPALDKDLAEWLQAELLKRAHVQKVVSEAR